MRVLESVQATPEQLQVLQHRFRTGTLIVRGAAGSGKTTTALLRIKYLLEIWSRTLARTENRAPRVLVLTYNRTLRGYIAKLAEQQVVGTTAPIEIETFATWAVGKLGARRMVEEVVILERLTEFAHRVGISLPPSFIRDEVMYVTGRLLPEQLAAYPTDGFQRDGRGLVPRVPRAVRQTLLDGVILPYNAWKASEGLQDWSDLAVQLFRQPQGPAYDIVVVDEAQDFTANRVRAILKHTDSRSSVTFVLDAAQRIYPEFFHWNEVGIDANPLKNVCTLRANHRNTREIAAFAKPLVDGIAMGPDASLPDLNSCSRGGKVPVVLIGRYSAQVTWAVEYVRSIDLATQSVAFLHPKGWFDYLKESLRQKGVDWVELTRNRDWPDGPHNVALSTMHSAKGLEFDHVLLLGLNDEVIDSGDDPNHISLESARRLVAMAITRARNMVVLGYKQDDAPGVAAFLKHGTYKQVIL